MEALAPSIYAPLYSQIYKATIDTFPGAFFLVGGGLKVFALLIFLWMYLTYRKERSQTEVAEESIQNEFDEEKSYVIGTIGDVLSVHV